MTIATLLLPVWVTFLFSCIATVVGYKYLKTDPSIKPRFLTGVVPATAALCGIAVFMLLQASDGGLASVVVVAVFIALLGAGAGHSFAMKIAPNSLVMAVVILFGLYQFLEHDLMAAWPRLLAAAVVLGLGMLAGRQAGLGAGAVKIMAALSLWVSLGALPFFIIGAILISGIYAGATRKSTGQQVVNIVPPLIFTFLPFLSL